jgi:hypothetical protein
MDERIETTSNCNLRQTSHLNNDCYSLEISYRCALSTIEYRDLSAVGITVSTGQELISEPWIPERELTFRDISQPDKNYINFHKSEPIFTLTLRYLTPYLKYGVMRQYGPDNLSKIPIDMRQIWSNTSIFVLSMHQNLIFNAEGEQKIFRIHLYCDSPEANQLGVWFD